MKLFITGTDTEVGKTYVTKKLIQQTNQQGYSTLGLKPIASGCNDQNAWVNEDALTLQQASSIKANYSLVNPYAFAPAIAPHIAARQSNVELTPESVYQACLPGFNLHADYTFIEGAGGLLTPLNEQHSYIDFIRYANLSVILVVGMKLGCINHALLTARAITQSGITLYGWIANCIDPDMAAFQDNLAILRQRIAAPCLQVFSYKATHPCN